MFCEECFLENDGSFNCTNIHCFMCDEWYCEETYNFTMKECGQSFR